ncbi:hypothetical protein KZZ20_09715 [Methylacidiphilum fumariolicum]|uniref:Uncharacterized protein n=2 Tax=Candidatus Methylacidiphilum fumarolicum TaxID=591154 RepID=I0JZE5_METFB|nr:hypothetical protein [Candidatus Methylacidiphilum fumarolicum]MBW6415779.1 hypothetical protein [Candidatus Methylacidiphilum fumarolicum]CAI9085138.1 conserved protein of unknown function [Candidatus Methylacidiphilum fumarolicum]CCG92614.1 hypothetical protein MFUM_710011 [Methylacidiphilum fumariolicum SolV]
MIAWLQPIMINWFFGVEPELMVNFVHLVPSNKGNAGIQPYQFLRGLLAVGENRQVHAF